MKKLSFSQICFIGITLFSMFFGAGNLIFAPYMGVQAGTHAIWALLGFVCTAVILPISAVIIISLYGDGRKMVGTISPAFAKVFITLIYLLIGPCVAIPRTASTSYEMFGWLFADSWLSRIIYTVLFFALCALTAWKPGKLKDVLGKVMGPILVILILVLSLTGLFTGSSDVASAASGYQSGSFLTGFCEGYQTMDILAAFCFGIVILLNIEQAGITDQSAQRKVLCKAALVAGVLLASLYALLAMTGMKYSGLFQNLNNGAQILSNLASMEFGSFGEILISLIFFIACYNVCSGLLSCCAEYFLELSGKLNYGTWLAFFTIAGACLAVFGLDAILQVSSPILSIICPIAILLLAWGLLRYIYTYRKEKKASR